MNKADLVAQITKYKARRLKTRLAHYCTTLSLLLVLSILSSDSFLTSLLLVLPLPLYFARESYKLARKSSLIKQKLQSLQATARSLDSRFSLKSFLTQNNFSFRLTLILFFLVIFTTFARLSDSNTNSTITYHLESNN